MGGYFTGVLDLYYAKMTTEDTASTAPVYGAPSVLAKNIEVTITPVYREGKLHASNAMVRNTKRVDGYTLSANVDKVSPAVQADVLGRVKDTNSVQIVKGSNVPPKVAVGFACTLDDGTKEFWWLYKGEFAEPTKSAKTDGENIEYQTPTLEANFVRRMNDDALSAVVDTGDEDVPASVASNWFSAVYEAGSAASPDVDELPIGAVLAVAALPADDISLTTVYVLTANDGERDAGTMWRRVSDAWAEYGA